MTTNAFYVGRPTRWCNSYADQDIAELVRLFLGNCLISEFICSVSEDADRRSGKSIFLFNPVLFWVDMACKYGMINKIVEK